MNMRTASIAAFASLLLLAKGAGEDQKSHDYIYPELQMDVLIRFVEAITHKKVEVEDPQVLARVTSLVLPKVEDDQTVLKVLKALLLLEGFELVDSGADLKLVRLLTDEQCTALNDALGRPGSRQESDPVPRERELMPRQPLERE